VRFEGFERFERFEKFTIPPLITYHSSLVTNLETRNQKQETRNQKRERKK